MLKKEWCELIVVTASGNRITATGHARYAQPGKDIVCAAVSALTLSLVHALHDLTPGLARGTEDDGNVIAAGFRGI